MGCTVAGPPQWYTRCTGMVRPVDGWTSSREESRAGLRARAMDVEDRERIRYKQVSEVCLNIVFLVFRTQRTKD